MENTETTSALPYVTPPSYCQSCLPYLCVGTVSKNVETRVLFYDCASIPRFLLISVSFLTYLTTAFGTMRNFRKGCLGVEPLQVSFLSSDHWSDLNSCMIHSWPTKELGCSLWFILTWLLKKKLPPNGTCFFDYTICSAQNYKTCLHFPSAQENNNNKHLRKRTLVIRKGEASIYVTSSTDVVPGMFCLLTACQILKQLKNKWRKQLSRNKVSNSLRVSFRAHSNTIWCNSHPLKIFPSHHFIIYLRKLKVNFAQEQAMKTQWVSRGTALLFL